MDDSLLPRRPDRTSQREPRPGPAYAPTLEFSRKQLRNPNLSRVIQGVRVSGGRALSVGLLYADDGADHGARSALWIRADALPLVAHAINSAREGRNEVVGQFQDGAYGVRVSCGTYGVRVSGDPGIYFQRLDASDAPVGRSVPIAGPELDALDKGLGWLAKSFAA